MKLTTKFDNNIAVRDFVIVLSQTIEVFRMLHSIEAFVVHGLALLNAYCHHFILQ